MTLPPFDPAAPAPVPSEAHTEPVPPFQPSFQPAFQPVAPEAAPDAAPVIRAEPVRRGSSGSSRVLNLALGLAVVVAAAGIAFAAGRATAPATVATAGISGRNGSGAGPNASFDLNGGGFPDASGQPGGFTGRGTGGRGFGGFGGGLTITGTVDSVSADSITIKTESGQTVTVGLDGSTTYHQQADAAASDVTAGKTVQLQITGGFRPGQNGASGGSVTLGTAGSVTIVP